MDQEQQADLHSQGDTASRGEEQIPANDAAYWYAQRQEEKQKKLAAQPEEKPAPVVPDQFVTRDEFMTAQRERQVMEYVRQNPEFQPYVEKVLKYWNHPTRAGLPVDSAFADAIGPKELMRLGAEQARRESEEAQKTQLAGGAKVRTFDSSITAKDVFSMSNEEFAKLKAGMKGI